MEKVEIKNTATNRHEEEMQRLIAEVEAKMKAKKELAQEAKPEVETDSGVNKATVHSNQLDFSESPHQELPENGSAVGGNQIEDSDRADEQAAPEPSDEGSSIGEVQADTVSLSESLKGTAGLDKNKDAGPQSNLPQFLSTWQNWLKLDTKPTGTSPLLVSDSKEKAIEKFIETQPKISRLKEDFPTEAKDRSEDISHLMTETLANLYSEQRLYTKAISAYEILIKKFPDKQEVYEQKIASIRETRQNNLRNFNQDPQ